MLKIFKKKNIVFVIIEFNGVNGAFDYPDYMPIPMIGERVIFNGKSGRVTDISHNTEGTFSEIKISCSDL